MALLIGIGGVAGAALTYVLTSWRERCRTQDAYRAPQRRAIGGVVDSSLLAVLGGTRIMDNL
jgi:hypothetical protein